MIGRKLLHGGFISAAILCAVNAVPAIAADTEVSAGPAEASNAETYADIVVTARKRAESIQEVPMSITAFSQDTLRAQNITSAFQLDRAVPGLTVSTTSGNPGNPAFAIRGRGQNFGTPAGGVETYFADVPLSGPFLAVALPPQFFDVQSFQVLKGPQGTLFGRSTTGGAVSIVPKAPTHDFEGYARVQVGNYDNFQAEGAINLPLNEIAALRIAGFRWSRTGYGRTFPGNIDRLTGKVLGEQRYNNQDVSEIRATLLIEPSDRFSNSTILTYHDDKNIASAGAGLQVSAADRAAGSGSTPSHGFGTLFSDSDVEFGRQGHNRVLALINTSTFNVSDDVSLKNIFGYIHSNGNYSQGTNADGSALITISQPPTFRGIKNSQYTNELQLQGSSFDDRLSWIVGGLADLTRQPLNPDNINISSILYVASPGCGAGCNVIRTLYGGHRVNSFAGFASGTFSITTDLKLTGGFRRTWDAVTLLSGDIRVAVPQTPDARPSLAPAALVRQFHRFAGNTYNADLTYKLASGDIVYAGYRHGYKRGGFNPIAADPARAFFGAEQVDNFYAGFKSEFDLAGQSVRLNVEGYYDKYRGQHASYLGFMNGVAVSVTTNVDRTSYKGLDIDLDADLTPWFNLRAAYGYIDAKVDKWADTSAPGSTVDLTVNPVPYVAKHKLTTTGRFHHEVEGLGDFALATTLSYQSKTFTNPTCVAIPRATELLFGAFNSYAHGGCHTPARTLVDLRVEWNNIGGSRLSAALNAENLTDKIYRIGTNSTLLYGVEGDAYGPPRMITFDLSYRF